MDQMHEIDLELNDLRKTYLLPAPLLHRRGQGKPKIKQALAGVSLTLGPGLYGLLGPNGAGKSTLIGIITGGLAADSGEVLWCGRPARGIAFRRVLGYMPQQVQDFYPTPSTLSTCMYYTGYDPRTMEKVYTPVSHHEKEMQRALIQYKKPENYDLVKEALLANNRSDLIGFGPKCLIPPRKIRSRSNEKSRKR